MLPLWVPVCLCHELDLFVSFFDFIIPSFSENFWKYSTFYESLDLIWKDIEFFYHLTITLLTFTICTFLKRSQRHFLLLFCLSFHPYNYWFTWRKRSWNQPSWKSVFLQKISPYGNFRILKVNNLKNLRLFFLKR